MERFRKKVIAELHVAESFKKRLGLAGTELFLRVDGGKLGVKLSVSGKHVGGAPAFGLAGTEHFFRIDGGKLSVRLGIEGGEHVGGEPAFGTDDVSMHVGGLGGAVARRVHATLSLYEDSEDSEDSEVRYEVSRLQKQLGTSGQDVREALLLRYGCQAWCQGLSCFLCRLRQWFCFGVWVCLG